MQKVLTLAISLCSVISLFSTENPLYNTIGQTYDAARCADPEITNLLSKYLCVHPNGKYVDICCGSGNYTISLYNQGLNISGIDISETMIKKACAKNNRISWFLGDAHHLPYADNSFEGALCISAIHHLGDLKVALKEISRILKPSGKLVIFTSTKRQCEKSWLVYYFPFLWQRGQNVLMDEVGIKEYLLEAGFSSVKFENFFVKPDTQDLYLYAGKYKPEIYLNEIIRKGMSPFCWNEFSEDIAAGLKELEADILSGKVHEIIGSQDEDVGENVFVIAEKI